jgi:hypothetical protein
MIYITDCAEIECLSQGQNQIGAMLLPMETMKFLQLLDYKRGQVPRCEHILEPFKELNDDS